MNCDQVYELLVDRRYGHLQGRVQDALAAHLGECEGCRIEAASLDELASTLDRWQVPDPPPGLAALAVERSFRQPHHPSPEAARAGQVFAYLGLGLGAAVLSMILVVGATPRLSIPALSLGLIGAVWTVLYGAAFAQALQQDPRIQVIARVALLGAGLTVLAAPVLSIPSIVEACRQVFEGARGSLGLNLLLFVVGSLYTGIPIFIAAVASGRTLKTTNRPMGSSQIGLLFTLLIAPAVYIQCAALAMGLVTTWIAGSLIAALTGPAAGIWLGTRLATHRA